MGIIPKLPVRCHWGNAICFVSSSLHTVSQFTPFWNLLVQTLSVQITQVYSVSSFLSWEIWQMALWRSCSTWWYLGGFQIWNTPTATCNSLIPSSKCGHHFLVGHFPGWLSWFRWKTFVETSWTESLEPRVVSGHSLAKWPSARPSDSWNSAFPDRWLQDFM
jgi:hypothetical protein